MDLARLLIEHGAPAAAQDQQGRTPLRRTFSQGRMDLALTGRGGRGSLGRGRGSSGSGPAQPLIKHNSPHSATQMNQFRDTSIGFECTIW